jgi:predicted dehydrogenase
MNKRNPLPSTVTEDGENAQVTPSRKNLEKATEFEDMRQMFADPKVEAVSIATPNQWHALSAIWAMKAGKAVCGEPACYNIHEGMRKAFGCQWRRANGPLWQPLQ